MGDYWKNCLFHIFDILGPYHRSSVKLWSLAMFDCRKDAKPFGSGGQIRAQSICQSDAGSSLIHLLAFVHQLLFLHQSRGAQPMAHEPPRLILAFWVAHFNICKFHALFGAIFMHSIHACTMYIKCMYSVYKFIVLGACIVYMCVELSSCRLANLNFPKCL